MQSAGAASTRMLFVTNVDNYGPYLKICGHLNRSALDLIRTKVQQLLHTCTAIDPTWPLPRQESLVQPGIICLYKRITATAPAGFEFLRTRVISAAIVNNARVQVEVEFIDYGYISTVGSYELLLLEKPEEVQNIPPLCSQFIVLGICHTWSSTEIDEIGRMISQQMLEINIKMELDQYKFITMKWKGFNLTEYLIFQKNIGSPVANDLLLDSFTKLLKDNKDKEQDEQQYAKNLHMNGTTKGPTVNYTPFEGAELVPVMPPVFSGPNNHQRQTNVTMPSNDQQQQRNLTMRLQHQQQFNTQFHQQLQRPRTPHTVGNLRSMYQGVPYQHAITPSVRGASVYASTPNGQQPPVVNPFQISQPLYQHPMHAARIMLPPPPPLNYYVKGKGMANSAQVAPRRTSAATFKSNVLQVRNKYEVYVSFVENGPCLFSVQLASAQEELSAMMNRIENVPLEPLSEKPNLGSACIARYSEDGQLYRALIVGVQPNVCKVAYIDYGNAELVQFRDLYEIPDEFLTLKPFAIRFTLSGYKELEPIDESLKKAFKDLVIYHHCQLEVMPLEGPPLVQYCQLFLKEENILDVLKQIQKKRLVYAKAEDLQNNDVVEIRYIDSPRHFYVQKITNIPKFEELMDEMFAYYNTNQKVPAKLTLGAPCIVKYDKEWYRAEVMRADDTAIVVRHVDFGYEQKVTQNLLSNIAEEHLKLPRQAVQCCLKTFENNGLTKDCATVQFEMLAEESNVKRRSFHVKVFRIQPDGVNLVNLLTKDLNVMKKLYKFSVPFEQYLELEKDDFHSYTNGNGKTNGMPHKTPSLASSDAVSSLHSSKKNMTLMQHPNYKSKDQSRKMLHSTAASQTTQEQQQKLNSSLGSEGDVKSTASSKPNDNKKPMASPPKQQQTHNGNKRQAQSQGSKNGLNTSGDSYRSSSGIQNGHNESLSSNTNTLDSNNNKQRNKGQPKSPQQQQQQRSQNAPQGYSQSRNEKTGENSTKSSISNKNSGESDVEEYVSLDHVFPTQPLDIPSKAMDVIICWWISPYQFYTHLKKRSSQFERLMSEMQRFYKKKPLEQLQLRVGANVVARHRQDNQVYRARVIGCNHMLRKYKVYFVDYGNQYTVTSEDIWQVEQRFANFPCMAYLCSFNDFIANFDHLHIIDCMEKYLPAGAHITCDYVERIAIDSKISNVSDMYYVDVQVKGKSLKNMLITDKLITEVPTEMQLDLFAGQQIRAKLCDIKDLLHFKIQLEGQVFKILSCYDDLRFVKSNPHLNKKFREFYEGKWCVLNIKDVNDNKVLLLRPLLPLFKEEVVPYICPQAVCMKSFTMRIVHVASATRVYGHPAACYELQQQLLDDMFEFYENNGEALTSCEVDKMCAAKSEDGNWYRARIESVQNDLICVFYIDYGNTEELTADKLKRLEKVFYEHSSCYALETNLPMRVPQDNSEKAKKSTEMLKQKLTDLVTDMEVEVEVLEVRKNHLIADLFNEKNESIVGLLEKQRDVEYMRKVLEKDKKNVYEYVETVDLTVEDEAALDDSAKKTKAKLASPKKQKKTPKTTPTTSPTKAAATPETTVVLQEEETKVQNKSLPIEETISVKEKDEEKIRADKTMEILDAKEMHINELLAKVAKEKEAANEEEKNETPTTPTPISVASSASSEVDAYAGMEKAVLSHCHNPAQFFIHTMKDVEELNKLQENLQIVASSLPPLMGLHTGAHCICSYSMDKKWYRARVIDADEMIIEFIDYGNTDCVTDVSDLKEMGVFPDKEPFCKPCALPIKPNAKLDWPYAANAIFNESYDKTLHIQYLTRGDNEKRSFINLFVDGVNVADKLVEDGYAKYLEIVQTDLNCYISHVNGISDFFLQYEKDSKALELIEMYLADNVEQLKCIEGFEKSRIVAAKFADDEMWYRAKMLRQLDDNNYEVLFIDYGNTSTTSECREISEEIAQATALSKHCALELPANCVAWSQVAEEKFAEIAAQGETIFTVELREPKDGYAAVHLFIDGHNINEDLAPLCEQVPVELQKTTIANFMNQSLCNTTMHSTFGDTPVGTAYEGVVCAAHCILDFYVHITKEEPRLLELSSSLQALVMEAPPLTTAQVNDHVVALVEEGKLYRACVLEVLKDSKDQPVKWRVFLLDYGTEHIATELRVLPLGLEQVSPFAKHCQLDVPDEWAAHDMEKLFRAFLECIEEAKVLRIELLRNELDPAVVKLLNAKTNEDICALMQPKLDAQDEVVMADKNDKGIISHALTPTHFYMQRKSNIQQLEVITKALEKSKAELFGQIGQPLVDDICAALAEEDDCYYRARVLSPKFEGSCVVQLIDQGNVISCKTLRSLPKELESIPPQAEKCALACLPEGYADNKELWTTQFSAFVEDHFGEYFEIEAANEENGVQVVILSVNFESVVESLTKAVDVAVKVGNAKTVEEEVVAPLRAVLHDCNIIHVNSPHDFYIQLDEHREALADITDKLLDAETDFSEVVEPLTQGSLCAALFPDDEVYYRARVLQVLADKNYEVHYIDFGNNATTDQVRKLPDEMKELPAYASHCSLYDLPEPLSVDMCEQFSSLVDAHFTETFQVEFLRSTVQPQICRIFFNQRNVARDILDMLKSDHINSTDIAKEEVDKKSDTIESEREIQKGDLDNAYVI